MIRIKKHQAVLGCGSFEVQYDDGRPSLYFYWDDIAGRGVRSEQITREQALEAAKAFARGERDQAAK